MSGSKLSPRPYAGVDIDHGLGPRHYFTLWMSEAELVMKSKLPL
jgi:hypothetical protein